MDSRGVDLNLLVSLRVLLNQTQVFRLPEIRLGRSKCGLIRLFQQRPRCWFSVRNRHNIWLSRTDKLKQPN